MAKAKVQGLEKTINRVFKRYETALMKAITYAADEAEFDIGFEARSCLYQYYDNYDPNWYHRTDSLINAFVPYNKIIADKNELVAHVGMSYDPSKLDGLYYSEGSKKTEFNPVRSEWILENYLSGIHPRTNGYPLYNKEDESVIYDPVIDVVSPDARMNEYLQKYTTTFNNNVLKSFAKQITRR